MSIIATITYSVAYKYIQPYSIIILFMINITEFQISIIINLFYKFKVIQNFISLVLLFFIFYFIIYYCHVVRPSLASNIKGSLL